MQINVECRGHPQVRYFQVEDEAQSSLKVMKIGEEP